jgi:hypothetical protein
MPTMASLPRLEATVRRLMRRVNSPAPASSTSEALWLYEREPSEGGRTVPRALRDQRPTQPAPGLLTDDEIVRALRRFRYDREFRGPKRVPLRTLAELLRLSHMTIYEAMRPDPPGRRRRISEHTLARLSWAITAILEGRLRFRRTRHVWTVEGNVTAFERRGRR